MVTSAGVFFMKKWTLLFLSVVTVATAAESQAIDLKKVFTAAPLIYSVLSLLSIASMVIWLYSLATIRSKDILPEEFIQELKNQLRGGRFADAEALCRAESKLFSAIVSAGLSARKLGASIMIDDMKSEGKRATTALWQRLSLLNDIVIIAPMLGLLGTVIGMFYAFYDLNRSIESINALFDGLGIAVGTTVAGLIVAIIAMIFYTTLKYRIVKTLALVENEALAISTLMDVRQ
jgi:biopolymer transport protein ExbB